jgi:hypothetical protein
MLLFPVTTIISRSNVTNNAIFVITHKQRPFWLLMPAALLLPSVLLLQAWRFLVQLRWVRRRLDAARHGACKGAASRHNLAGQDAREQAAVAAAMQAVAASKGLAHNRAAGASAGMQWSLLYHQCGGANQSHLVLIFSICLHSMAMQVGCFGPSDFAVVQLYSMISAVPGTWLNDVYAAAAALGAAEPGSGGAAAPKWLSSRQELLLLQEMGQLMARWQQYVMDRLLRAALPALLEVWWQVICCSAACTALRLGEVEQWLSCKKFCACMLAPRQVLYC